MGEEKGKAMQDFSQYEGMSDDTFKTMVEHDLKKIEQDTGGAIHLILSHTADRPVENRKWHIKTPSTTRILGNIEVVGFIDGVNEAIAWAAEVAWADRSQLSENDDTDQS